MNKCINCKHFDNPDYVTHPYDLPHPRFANGEERGKCERFNYPTARTEKIIFGAWVTKKTESDCYHFEAGMNRWQKIYEEQDCE